MNLLAVDTAGAACSAALIENGRLRAEFFTEFDQTHARYVMELIHSLMDQAGIKARDIDAYGVTKGPGSFTGLRIGIATIKGMALAHDRPAVGISSLLALAHPWLSIARGLVCPVIDARKSEVYSEIYRFSDTGFTIVKPVCVCAPGTLVQKISRLAEPCLFIGSGAVLYRDLIIKKLGPLAFFAPDTAAQVRAASVGGLAYKRILEGKGGKAAGLAPVYIRKSDAERKSKTSAVIRPAE